MNTGIADVHEAAASSSIDLAAVILLQLADGVVDGSG
jgi:hypothetical protein